MSSEDLADALGEHGVGDLQEAGDVGAHDKVALLAVLLGGVVHVLGQLLEQHIPIQNRGVLAAQP